MAVGVSFLNPASSMTSVAKPSGQKNTQHKGREDVLCAEDETILVVEWDDPKQPIGYVYHKRALQVFNKALIEANIEEHR